MDYTPKNRHEKYLNAIRTNDTSDLPAPITREEKYLSEIAMNSGGGGEDYSVKYTEQSLTTEQQAQARENIGAAASTDIPTDAVKYSAQALTDAQKTQARTNIGAGTSNFNGDYNALRNAPPIAKSSGENAAAGGYYSTASGQYGFAFGNRVVTTHAGEVAFGKHNESSEDTAFAIGDGRDIQYRHNLMELKTDGTLLLNGNAVKTEGGDDDDDYYPMLGQIYKWSSPNYVYGFKSAFSGGYKVIDIIFYSDDHDASTGYSDVFGDFRVRTSTSASQTTIYLMVPDGAVVDTSRPWIHVQNGYYLFNQCPITTNTANAISKFDTSRVKNMARMFAGITAVSSLLSTIDLSSLDTRKVKTMEGMFAGSTAITALDLSSFDITNVVAYTDMFGDSSNPAGITTLKTPKINPHDDIPLPRTLYSQDGTAYTNLPVTTGTSIELRASWT